MSSPLSQSTSPLPAKTAQESRYALRVPIYSSMADDHGRVLPGVLLKLIDVAGCVPAKRHLGKDLDPMTASIDRMDFYAPIHPWEIVILDTRITRVWRTSMESRIVVTAWSFRSNESRAIATAYMVTVAVGEHGRRKALPEEVPPLLAIAPEDRLLMHAADLRKDDRTLERSQTPFVPLAADEDQLTVIEAVMRPQDSNGLDRNVFGGVILSQMHQAAHEAMTQFLQAQSFVCARQDRMDFVAPALIGEVLQSRAAVSQTFATSLEVQVECEACPLDGPGQPRLVATTYFIFVQVDDAGQPTPVRRWEPHTPRHHKRALGAQARRHLRDEERLVKPHEPPVG